MPAEGPLAEKPSLIKELPIASYVFTVIFAGGGAALYQLLGVNAINDLKNPAKHTTPDATHTLVIEARVGQVSAAVLFPVMGITAVVGTFKTISAVRKIAKMMPSLPPVGVSVGPVQGGMAFGLRGGF
jgi:hypothetical protein